MYRENCNWDQTGCCESTFYDSGQPTSVCTKPPQTQSLLHYITTLPVKYNGTLLHLARTVFLHRCEKWIKPRLISQVCVHAKLGNNTHLWNDAHLWETERNSRKNAAPNGRRICCPSAHQSTHKPAIQTVKQQTKQLIRQLIWKLKYIKQPPPQCVDKRRGDWQRILLMKISRGQQMFNCFDIL